MILERNAFVLHSVLMVVSMSLRSNGLSSEKECIIRPEGLLHCWNTEEPLKINIFIPTNWWWRRPENSYLYFSTASNISFILNSTEINFRSGDFWMTNFISFQPTHKPVAGWTSIFLFIRDGSIQMEDQEHNPLIKSPESQNSLLNNLTGHETLRLKIKGMNAAVNCHSEKRTFSASPDTSLHNENKIKIPITLFNDETKVSFYSNDSMQILLVHGENTTMICKEFMDPKSDTLLLRNPEEMNFCALQPKKHYYLNVSSSMLEKRNIESNGNLKIGFLNFYLRNKILITTDAFSKVSKQTSQLTDQHTGTSLHLIPPLIIVSVILTIVIIAGIGAVVWRTVRLKRKTRQEQLYSSESWTQQNFDSVRSSTLHIKNTSYESTGAQGGKKFSISSDYSGPVDEEYDEPIYSDGRESIYESIYESAYSPPLPPELPKEFVK